MNWGGFARGGLRWQKCSREQRTKQPTRLRGRIHVKLAGSARHRGAIRGNGRSVAVEMRAESRRDHPFLVWAPFDAPARIWAYGEFCERVGALAAGLAKRGIKPGEYVLIHLDNCVEAMLAWFACVELGAIAVTTNTRSAPAEMEYFADHCGAVAAITQPAYAEVISAHCRNLRWLAVISHDAGAAQGRSPPRGDSFEA